AFRGAESGQEVQILHTGYKAFKTENDLQIEEWGS
ncbi:unnamed protein product, partial [marine sediment metagenome]